MMTEPEILDTLTTIFRAALADETIMLKPETTAADIPKWDSYRYVDIIVRVENTLGIKIRAREANKAKSVGDIVAMIQTKLN
jgi:acyl carrier protein